ncbi:MAG: hypothetical protein H6907_14480 [Hyphomicrobiales bacterium]|nr:hypothetical protein [Hyphomicrobiales bacterium]
MHKLLLASAAALLALAGAARADGVSFVADAVQSHPQHGTQQGKLYVSDLGTRFEVAQQGQTRVQIYDAVSGLTRALFPDQKTYMEWRGGGGVPGVKPDNPCPSDKRIACDKQATETVGNVSAEKWRLSSAQGRTAMIWWDPQRRMVVRQESDDGQVMQMTFLGPVRLDGRAVENWRTVFQSSDGKQSQTEQYYDPAIGLAVRETFPNGVVRELRNIRMVAPDPKLFQVPAGYRQVQPPPQGQQGGRGAMPQGRGGYPPRTQ